MNDNSQPNDQLVSTLEEDPEATNRKNFRVISESGLFKRGEQYDTGTLVALDEKTAENFLENGDIEPIGEGQNDA